MDHTALDRVCHVSGLVSRVACYATIPPDNRFRCSWWPRFLVCMVRLIGKQWRDAVGNPERFLTVERPKVVCDITDRSRLWQTRNAALLDDFLSRTDRLKVPPIFYCPSSSQ